MDPMLTTLGLGLAGGLLLGCLIGALWMRARGGDSPAVLEARHQAIVAQLRAEEQEARGQLGADLAAAEASVMGLREQLRNAQEQYREALERQRQEAEQRARAEQAEHKVLQELAPVKQTLSTMQLKVAELEEQRARQHGELSEQLRTAAESEERLRATAESLASALRNNATRGVWGETQLRAVVESAGMLEHVDFDLQSSITVADRAARPDMVIRLPGGKHLAVDAKVPFNSYLEASTIPATASEAELARRAGLLDKHVKAVREHIAALGGRSYWSGLDASPEMVVAFIPSESLLAAALETDPTIMEFAFQKNVALASPVTLFSVLKSIAVAWRHEAVTNEAKTLFEVSRDLYGRLVTLAGHVEKLGRSIERSVKDYNSFVGSLERQALPAARRLSRLDASKVIADLDEIDEDTRQLTSSDLTAALEGTGTTEFALLDETLPPRPELEAPEGGGPAERRAG